MNTALREIPEPQRPRPFDWINFSVLVTTPIAAVVLAILYIRQNGFVATDLIPFVIMYFAAGMSITGGYHRMYSHRAYQAHPVVQWLYLVFGAAALQNSAYAWTADHRNHHRFSDTDRDPYNIKKGFWWAHIGWIFWGDPVGRDFSNVKDLEKDKLVQWQKRYYLLLAVGVGFGLPYLMGLPFDRPWGAVLWGGLIRLVFVHHCTFLINSAAHTFGKNTYSEETTAKDSWLLAFFSYGEGYHNFHHTFPTDYRNGVGLMKYDPTKWMIWAFSKLGLAKHLKTTPATLMAVRGAANRGTGVEQSLTGNMSGEQVSTASADSERLTQEIAGTVKTALNSAVRKKAQAQA